jgi:general secretion pathway protein G
MTPQRRAAQTQGFTLIEVIVVVFILGLLAALVAPKIMGRTEDAKINQTKVQIRNFETALKLYKLDNGSYPSTVQGLEALTSKPSTGKLPNNYRQGGYLEQSTIPKDPWGNPYVYVSPGVATEYEVVSFGGDGAQGGQGEAADISSASL